MEDERQPPAASASAVSKVIDDDDLLVEILLRVSFPTTLVHAALVCKRWLGHVSDRAFLRRFRELHPPRILGFYIDDLARDRATPPPFVPVLPQPPELAAVVHRSSFSLDVFRCLATCVRDCRNGSIFCSMYSRGGGSTCRVHSPLCPERGLAIPLIPAHKYRAGDFCILSQVLSKEEGDGLSYFYLYVESRMDTLKPEFKVHVYMLQDGSWCLHNLVSMDQLHRPRLETKAVLVGNKIYMAFEPSNIIVLDLATSSFSKIQLPRGVDHVERGTTMLSRAHDASGVYLIHVEEFQLRTWLHKEDNWLLVDTICLHEMCDNLKKSGFTTGDEHTLVLMNQVVDYGDSVFLKMGGCALQLDLKCWTLRKVYETKYGCLSDIHPFMMIWPPKFPALKYEHARNAT